MRELNILNEHTGSFSAFLAVWSMGAVTSNVTILTIRKGFADSQTDSSAHSGSTKTRRKENQLQYDRMYICERRTPLFHQYVQLNNVS